jgi:L-fuculose-phosphate aldolase
MKYLTEKNQLVEFGRRLHDFGFIAGYDGNLSVRDKNGHIHITPAGAAKGFLSEADIVTVDGSGKVLSGSKSPSSELAMHLIIYRLRPEIAACCHAHPPYSTAFAAIGRVPAENILPEVIAFVGKIQLVEYLPTGLPEKWERFEKYVGDNHAFLLANHGLLTIGRTMEEAYFRLETVEHYSKIIYIAERMGPVRQLDPKEIERLKEIGKSLRK